VAAYIFGVVNLNLLLIKSEKFTCVFVCAQVYMMQTFDNVKKHLNKKSEVFRCNIVSMNLVVLLV
jgi:hypothetical protein